MENELIGILRDLVNDARNKWSSHEEEDEAICEYTNKILNIKTL